MSPLGQPHPKTTVLVTDEDEEEFIEDEEDQEEGVSTEGKEGKKATILCPCALRDRCALLHIPGGGGLVFIITFVLPFFCTSEVCVHTCMLAHVCAQAVCSGVSMQKFKADIEGLLDHFPLYSLRRALSLSLFFFLSFFF